MEDHGSPGDQHMKRANRPHCFYLWFLHGKAVCSEEVNDRACAYPFWKCPARADNLIDSMELISKENAVNLLQEVPTPELV
jgi:hypothetical protein